MKKTDDEGLQFELIEEHFTIHQLPAIDKSKSQTEGFTLNFVENYLKETKEDDLMEVGSVDVSIKEGIVPLEAGTVDVNKEGSELMEGGKEENMDVINKEGGELIEAENVAVKEEAVVTDSDKNSEVGLQLIFQVGPHIVTKRRN